LEYQLEAEIITKSLESMNLEIAQTSKTTSLNRTIAVEATTAKKTPGTGWIGAIAVMMAVSMIHRKKNCKHDSTNSS